MDDKPGLRTKYKNDPKRRVGLLLTGNFVHLLLPRKFSQAATPVSFNLVGNLYVNQNATFSDFHVTGGNPAGNASFTNPEFVVKRFTWVGFRELVGA